MQKASRLYKQLKPRHYNLTIDLTKAPEKKISGSVEILGTFLSSGEVRIHAKGLVIDNAWIETEEVSTRHEANDELVLISDAIRKDGEARIVIDYHFEMTDAMHGVYPCNYRHDGVKKQLFASQFESRHAREAFPCVDEPEAKATFDLQLYTTAGVEALSNMPTDVRHETSDGIVEHRFSTTPVMSTYLLAFVVGELHSKSATTKSGVEVRVWATPAQPDSLLDFPLDVAVRSIDFFDDYFGVAYPLPKADHVALPDFTVGAMENWGLITYREVALLADKNTAQSSKEWVATVIAHETSHQWFGNLVTMRWWDDLWLNESFATLMEYVAVDALFPKWNAWDNFASQETLSALRRDQLAGVQAVKVKVDHPDEINSIFDPSIVYAKGARLMKMLYAYIGEDAFRAGLKQYFKTHAYGNTEGDDLWKAFSDASGRDIGSFMHTWLNQSGLPLVRVETTTNGYRLSQHRFVLGEDPDDRTWPIPLSASQSDFPELLESRQESFDALHDMPLLNSGNAAHFVSSYDESAFALILEGIAGRSTIDRLALLHETSLLSRTGDMSTAAMIPLLNRYRHETEEPVWGIMSLVIADLRRFVEQDEIAERNLKQFCESLARPLLKKYGFIDKAEDTEQDIKLRALGIGLLAYAEAEDVIDWGLGQFRATENLTKLAAETRSTVFTVAARHGNERDFKRLLNEHDSSQNSELREDIASGVVSTKDAAHIDLLLSRITDSEIIKPQDVTRWFVGLLRNRHSREASWRWMTDNWAWIEKTFGGDKSYDDYPRYAASILNGYDWLERYTKFFAPMSTATGLKRAIEIGTTELETRSEWIQRDQADVIDVLAQETG